MKRILFLLGLILVAHAAASQDLPAQVTHGVAQNGDVKLHYATMGEGPLIVMIHGFPDFWYSWRHQMPALAKEYKVVAYDQRGYNESDKPEGQEQYDMTLLVADAAAVIRHFGVEKAIVVGHDWGGVVAWGLAANMPEVVDKLVICNLPHPKNLARELATNKEQQANAAYARAFQEPGAEEAFSGAFLTDLVMPTADEATRAAYIEAFDKSDFTAMLNYYRQNYPREPYSQEIPPFPNIKAPVLQFHGLKDTALLANGLNNTWSHLDNTFTLVTIPDAGHWVHHDTPELVTNTIIDWLKRN